MSLCAIISELGKISGSSILRCIITGQFAVYLPQASSPHQKAPRQVAVCTLIVSQWSAGIGPYSKSQENFLRQPNILELALISCASIDMLHIATLCQRPLDHGDLRAPFKSVFFFVFCFEAANHIAALCSSPILQQQSLLIVEWH